jgi:predicted phosphoadenosine phosphosulfate sulfurtransferase
MARVRRFLDIDVLTAARRRIAHVYDTYDTIWLAFSGGKDSAVCVHLAREELEKRGELPVLAYYNDEEFIPGNVAETVERYHAEPWIRLRYICPTMLMMRFSLGEAKRSWSWDPRRPWFRQPPAIAERPEKWFKNSAEFDALMLSESKGRVAFIMGIRAEESLLRYRSVVNRLGPENFITKSEHHKQLHFAKPIYDWYEADVLKFLWDRKISIPDWYEQQNLTGQKLRVSTPLHAEAIRKFHLLKRQEPALYQFLVNTFDDVTGEERWGADVDMSGTIKKYAAKGIRGCIEYVRKEIKNPQRKSQAWKLFKLFQPLHEFDPDAYPVEAFLKVMVRGSIHLRKITARHG